MTLQDQVACACASACGTAGEEVLNPAPYIRGFVGYVLIG